jgi:tetratricopeptide (TPR) repeat protein
MRVTRVVAWVVLLACSLAASETSDGIQAFKEGHYSIALQKLAGAKDTTSKIFFALAKAATGDCASALPTLTTASTNDSDLYRIAGLAAAKCYSATGETSKAFPLLERLSQQFPNDADVLYLAAKLHMKAYNEATLAMFKRTPASYRVHELSGEIFEVENRYSEAISEYRKAIAVNPQAADLHFRLGRAMLLDNHDPETLQKAADEFRAELKISPEDSACEFQLGQIAQAQGNGDSARPHFERALQLTPTFVQALIALGKLESQAKNYPRAIELLSQATALQPSNETAHYALLTAYRDSGQLDKATSEKATLDKLQQAPEGEFSEFLKKIGEKPPK